MASILGSITVGHQNGIVNEAFSLSNFSKLVCYFETYLPQLCIIYALGSIF
jgi:hypothetical protein